MQQTSKNGLADVLVCERWCVSFQGLFQEVYALVVELQLKENLMSQRYPGFLSMSCRIGPSAYSMMEILPYMARTGGICCAQCPEAPGRCLVCEISSSPIGKFLWPCLHFSVQRFLLVKSVLITRLHQEMFRSSLCIQHTVFVYSSFEIELFAPQPWKCTTHLEEITRPKILQQSCLSA